MKNSTINVPFLRRHADVAVLHSAQLALYVTVCKLLQPELVRLRKRRLES
jgi:hypothetical protein